MALILNIDTATETGSVCLARDGISLGIKINSSQKDHAAVLAPFIKEILQECNTPLSGLQAVAVSGGPGSYTGLRVAASAAKGLCYALGIPLIAVNTLEMMAVGMRSHTGTPDVLFCPVIDARRMDVFTALYERDMQALVKPGAVTLNDGFLKAYEHREVAVFGTGMEKTRKLLSGRDHWRFAEFTCRAEYLVSLSETAFNKKRFEDVAYFEPFYHKPFYSPPGKNHESRSI